MIDKLNDREKILIWVFVIICIIAIYYLYLLKPIYQEIRILKNKINQHKQKLQELSQISLAIPDLKKELQQIKTDYLAVQKYNSENEIFKKIKKEAENKEVKLINFNPRFQKNKVTINLDLQGNYSNLLTFIKTFKKWKNWVKFKTFSLNVTNNTLKLQLLLIFYLGAGGQ